MKEPTRLLLVDDNLGMLETLSDILTSYGFEVTVAVDAREAMEKAGTHGFDIAVIDIILPGINGIELIRRLRPARPATKFIVITAYTDSELAREARDEGVAAVLFKPVDPHELVTLVQGLAGSRNN